VNFDPSVLTWKDWILVGVGIGIWIANRGRRHMGERLGAVEKIAAVLAKLSGVEVDDRPARPRRRTHDDDTTPPERPPR
jgi:hypothetical protein